MQGIHQIETLVLLLLLFIVGFGVLAQKLKVPYPIVLVVGGLSLSVLPRVPNFSLNPDLVFLVILPPLLFSAAFTTSWRDFRYNLTSILLLAFGLVAFTTVGVGIAAQWLLPGFDWRLGLVLGAILSPTDAIAATSIARRLCLPQRITDILEGESLVNDASALLALQLAVATVATGTVPSAAQLVWRLIYLVLGGLVIGLVLGKLVYWFELRMDNAPLEITLSVLVPYLAYLGGEAAKASGVLAVVACGLYLGRRSSRFFSSRVRVEAWATWNTLTFVLNGAAFILIGLQLRQVLAGIRSVSLDQLLFSAGIVIAVIIVLRIAWVYPGAYVSFFVRRFLLHQNEQFPPKRAIFIIGWTGMRGVISLAAAISVPTLILNGTPFPQRNVIIFLTFCVIFVTLVLQGLTLPSLIRRLGLSGRRETNTEEQRARRKMIGAGLEALGRMRSQDRPEFDAIYDDLAQHYQRRLRALEDTNNSDNAADEISPAQEQRYGEITQKLREAERAAALKLRDENEISDAVLRRLEGELDLLDMRSQLRE